jgi:hypothetical protein
MPHGSNLTDALREFLETYGFNPFAGGGPFPIFLNTIQPTLQLDNFQSGGALSAAAIPTFAAAGSQGLIAAVFSMVGIQCGANPIRVLYVGGPHPTGSATNIGMGITDRRTANLSTLTPVGLGRGLATTTQMLLGTTAAAALVGDIELSEGASTSGPYPSASPGFRQFLMREGEFLWAINTIVNTTCQAHFLWEETAA